MTITVRRANRSDMSTIFKMSHELGAYLKERGPKHSLEDLYQDGGFDGNYAFFFALVAEDTDIKQSNGLPTAVGFTSCSYTFSWDGRSIYMNNLYVAESHRSQGIGRLIINELLRHAKEIRCNRIEFHVGNSNSAQTFYKKMGGIDATERYGHISYRIYRDVINKVDD